MTNLASAVVEAAESGESNFKPLYDHESSIDNKIETIAKEIYGATNVNYTLEAKKQMKNLIKNGFDKMPVCMVKTPKSLSDDDNKLGRPENFEVTVRDFEIAAGAGFIIPMLGDTMRMPGLPSVPAAQGMKIDDNGVVTGLS